MDKKKKLPGKNPTLTALDAIRLEAPRTDPQGSYTGRPEAPASSPVQDADDL